MIHKLLNKENKDLTINYDEFPLGDSLRRLPDINKAQLELNFKPKINLEAGLIKTISWFKGKKS